MRVAMSQLSVLPGMAGGEAVKVGAQTDLVLTVEGVVRAGQSMQCEYPFHISTL